MDSYILDVPSAHTYVISFLARAVVDEVLPPSFLSDPLVRSIGGAVIEDAMRLLSREHYGVRLERVWGPGDGRPVADLKVAMDQLLKEFLLSNELDEAKACVKVRARKYDNCRKGKKIEIELFLYA
jgi:programmed cell death protein 4